MAHISFVAETQPTAADLNVVSRQGMMVFTSTTDRDTQVSAILASYSAGGLWAVTTDTHSVWYYDGTEWLPHDTPWTSYDASSDWTNVTVGNGTIVASKRYIGGDLFLRGKLTAGATTSISGTAILTIPDSVAADSIGGSGSGALKDDSAVRTYPIVTDIAGSDTALYFYHPETPGVLNATTPFTFATSDILRWQAHIPVA